MRKAVEYLRTHPVIAVAIAVGIVGVVLLYPRPEPRTTPTPLAVLTPAATPGIVTPGIEAPGATPTPAAAPTPTPGAAPTPPPVAAPTPRPVAGPVDAGRPDPFAPLVTEGTQRPVPAPRRVTIPPPAPLPPPLFPGQFPQPPGVGVTPTPSPSPTPTPKEASTAELVGILGEAGGVAIIRVRGQTHVVARGDRILDKIRVILVDVARRRVILEQDGERFELRMGGVSGRHVLASAA